MYVEIYDILPSKSGLGTQIYSEANQRLLPKETVMSSICYVAYFRVSTVRQGASGLGLEAQKSAVRSFLGSGCGSLVREFTEVESGKSKSRPELAEAIDVCRTTGATLLIAKLDRLARNVAFIANLLESGVKFTAVDMPNADRFMLHVYAAMAEEEGRRISERTRAALASAKARGVALGQNGRALAAKNKLEADEFAASMKPRLRSLIDGRGMTFSDVATHLNHLNVATPRGGKWHASTVHAVWNRGKAVGTEAATAPLPSRWKQ